MRRRQRAAADRLVLFVRSIFAILPNITRYNTENNFMFSNNPNIVVLFSIHFAHSCLKMLFISHREHETPMQCSYEIAFPLFCCVKHQTLRPIRHE